MHRTPPDDHPMLPSLARGSNTMTHKSSAPDLPRIPLYSLLDETAAKHPTSPCTNFFGKQLTYHEIKQLSDRFAASIRRMGIQKGTGGSAPS